MIKKTPNNFRLCFQNINGLPVEAKNEKHQLLLSSMKEIQADYFGMIELNVNFNCIHPNSMWRERFKIQQHTHHVYNQHSTSTAKKLYGGVGAILSDNATHRCLESGEDPSGLGRWTWSKLQGKGGMILRIVTAYRPIADQSNRPGTVFSQQEKYFAEQNQIRNPRSAILEDLGRHIQKWIRQQEQIIMGIDLNEDTWDSSAAETIENWGMKNILKQHHPNKQKVATCNKNHRNIPIDAIWTTPGIDCNQCGMLGFGQLDQGRVDHRLLWVDIDEQSIFGFKPPPPAKRPSHGIPLRDPKLVKKINRRVTAERKRNHIPQRLFALEAKAQNGQFTTADIQQFESLLHKDYVIRQKARKKCIKFYAGKTPYSDVIGNNRKELHLWSLILQHRKKRRIDTRKLRRLMRQTGQGNALQLTEAEATTKEKQCRQRYWKHKKEAWKLRSEFEQKVNERRAKKYGTTIEAQEKITKSIASQKYSYGRVKQVMEKNAKTALSMVTYKDEYEEEHECITKEEIEMACKQEGLRRYTQVYNTPFVKGSLLQDVGMTAMTPAAQEILNGTYTCQPDVNEYTKKLIQELKKPDVVQQDSISGVASTKQHIESWKKMKKTTSSSPFSASFTELIAGCEDIRVADIDACFASIPLQAGFCPKSWMKAVDIMIPKKKTSREVEKLRIIVLFDALFNMVNKRIGKEMVSTAERNNQIPPEAYGSRKGYRAIDCALNKVLTADIIRQRVMIAALCSNDAKSCYDRIVHAVAILAMRRLGVTAETCHVMFGTLQQVEHYVSTTYGTSQEPYTAVEFPLQGVLQGNGAGPAIWLVTSIPLINMLRKEGFGFRSRNPINKREYRIVCYTFVDDTDTVHSPADQDTDVSNLMKEMQAMINHWEGGLRATGGALAIKDKSYWYCISFKWHKTKLTWEYNNIADTPGNLQVRNSEGNYETLDRFEVNTAKETLGLWIALDGNQDAQVVALKEKVTRWTAKITSRQLNSNEAWLSLQSGITKSLGYPLAATSLSKKQCQEIMAPLFKDGLPAIGVPKTFPNHLRHAPPKYLGLGIPSLWTTQAHDKMESCLRHGMGDIKHCTTNLFSDLLAGLRIELGLPSHPLKYPFKTFAKCTTNSYFHTLWEFCDDNGLHLQDENEDWQPHRQQDQFLMMAFWDNEYTPSQLRILNLCRKTQKVIRLSDIASGNGKQLTPGWNSPNFQASHNQNYDWPPVGPLPRYCWKMWEQAIRKCFAVAHPSTPDQLSKPLGSWLEIPTQWQWFLSPNHDELLQRIDDNKIQAFQPVHGRHQRNRRFQKSQMCQNIPPDYLPTTVSHSTQHPIDTGTASLSPRTNQDTTTSNWWNHCFRKADNLPKILKGISDGTAVAVTDGSFKQKRGTAAYILKDNLQSPDEVIYCALTPGYPQDQDPYRAELSGMLGVIRETTALAQQYHVSGTVTVACDCKSVLFNVFQTDFISPKQPHFDLLQATRLECEKSHLHWKWRYVEGHQDDQQDWEQLDPWQQLNVKMDHLAKSFWAVHDALGTPPFSLKPSSEWSVWHGERRLTNWNMTVIEDIIFGQTSPPYWQKRHQTDHPPDPDWNTIQSAMKLIPIHRRIWHSKWCSSALMIGKKLKKFGYQNTDACPRCGEPELTRNHIVQCQHNSATQQWKRKRQDLETWCYTSQTSPELRKLLLAAIDSWYKQETRFHPPTTSETKHLVEAQTKIGWKHLVDGFFVHQWAETQQKYYSLLQRRTSGKRWLSQLLRHLWQIAWDMWRHRQKIAKSDDSATTAAIHQYLNITIQEYYDQHNHTDHQQLRRWFARPLSDITSETIDFKQQWLETVSVLQATHQDQQAEDNTPPH